jgi:hypothetical protein
MPDQMEADVLAADDRRFEAMRKQDWGALDASLADDLVYVHSTVTEGLRRELHDPSHADGPAFEGPARPAIAVATATMRRASSTCRLSTRRPSTTTTP